MVCQNKTSFSIEIWDKYVDFNVIRKGEGKIDEEEAVNIFRTMAWVHRNDRTKEVTFRNELLTLICAARFIVSYFRELRFSPEIDKIISDSWNEDATNAKEVLQYAACLIEEKDVISMALVLFSSSNIAIKSIILGIFKEINAVRLSKKNDIKIDDYPTLGKLGNCISEYPFTSNILIQIIHRHLPSHRFATFIFPLLVKLNDKFFQSHDRLILDAGKVILPFIYDCTKSWLELGEKNHIGRQIKHMKSKPDQYFDKLLLKELGVPYKSLVTSQSYLDLFTGLSNLKDIPEYERKYLLKSLEWLSINPY
jgi:hypothetical protein